MSMSTTEFTTVITGAAGFLGSHLTDLLLSKGHRVIGIDNLITGNLDNLKHLEKETRFSFIEQDVTTDLSIEGKVDFIFHFASPEPD